ncbi:hypothetical protein [Staphylococcus simiae]|uniref:Uncharacterized protein n=1 Tax=Staphylococcus simiae CCM 7213 = CCUG 51256 TaxID=911238 RepID=G5JH43_9STAP|nr:hypothetical protein [Staphylococcus simiae]EHJ08391.1 hypothetical protein SS7213T_03860 [Staphylococcus simiae CCM 7213 = CCUG 51256]SNV66879.1 Uncharacterised protein [Staphylococcus simiae]
MSAKVKGMKDLEKALDDFTKNFEIHCMNCGKKYKVNLNKSKAKCPKCKTEMKIS